MNYDKKRRLRREKAGTLMASLEHPGTGTSLRRFLPCIEGPPVWAQLCLQVGEEVNVAGC